MEHELKLKEQELERYKSEMKLLMTRDIDRELWKHITKVYEEQVERLLSEIIHLQTFVKT